MRFLPSEHKAFKEIIDLSKYDYSTFSFVKKKGWLSISHLEDQSSFRFHRKNESLLDLSGKWVENETYFFGSGDTLEESTEFDSVCSEFNRWLKKP